MRYIVFFLCAVLYMATPSFALAQAVQSEVEYEVGIIRTLTPTVGAEQSSLDVRIEITQGSDTGAVVPAQYVFDTAEERERFEVGEQVVVYRTIGADDRLYFIAEKYRIPSLLWVFAAFALLVVVTTRLRGLYAFGGLVMSGVVIVQFIVPHILDGKNPFLISTIGALVILFVSLFTAHGFRPRTVIAAISMTLTIIFALIASYSIVTFTALNGLGSEEAFMVQFGLQNTVNVQGLLLGGIIIGVLGVLDDVTTAQVAAVEELYRANGTFTWRELYRRGFSVGKEHIISLVNTLVLAYAGASLPIFLLLHVSSQPWWVSINSEPFAEEIVRAIIGSMALIVAVPLTTLLAAVLYTRPWFRKIIVE